MPFSSIANSAGDALRSAGSYVSDLMTPTVRLGVTGLSRAGKTVFITSLVRNLVVGGRLPFFRAHASGRILRAYLEPQPDDAVPRFDYERHLKTLSNDPPDWPQSTRRISELRVTIEYEAESSFRRYLGPSKLHVDIVDYPGEWLTDLALLEKPYATWARESLDLVAARPAAPAARAFLDFAAALEKPAAEERDAEQVALEGARLFTAALAEARKADGGIATLSPGRFLMPGDLEGSPLLTFFPFAGTAIAPPSRGSGEVAEGVDDEPSSRSDLAGLTPLLARRYESYKTHVVRPFFRDHFSRIDRQIVLVDALGALHTGARAVADLERALEGVLMAFRPGTNSWLSSLLSKRVDHLLFAATKADHLHHTSHDRLEAILRLVTDRAIARAEAAGAEVRVMALAAVRATRETDVKQGRDTLHCIVGVPLPGEKIDGKVFDGKAEAAVFPGDLPESPEQALAALADSTEPASDVSVVRFRPPRMPRAARDGRAVALPHIRLDRALDFLIGDRIR